MNKNQQSLLNEIYNGWKNYIFPNKETEELAKKRISICTNKKLCDKLSKRKTCNICGCFMPAKVRNPKSRCPINKW